MKVMNGVAACLLLSGLMQACGTDHDGAEENSRVLGYYDSTTLWTWSRTDPNRNQLTVCWEDFDDSTPAYRTLIRQRIEATWQANSPIRFVGWQECSVFTDEDINIKINNTEGAYTEGLGKLVDNGYMVLMTNYRSFPNSWCNQPHSLNRCLGSDAIHEFGHALGIAHEHNRSDRDRDCTEAVEGAKGDTTVGSFDRDSIMNYCYDASFNDALSAGDVATIKRMYPN